MCTTHSEYFRQQFLLEKELVKLDRVLTKSIIYGKSLNKAIWKRDDQGNYRQFRFSVNSGFHGALDNGWFRGETQLNGGQNEEIWTCNS